jgi:hypothetical protein
MALVGAALIAAGAWFALRPSPAPAVLETHPEPASLIPAGAAVEPAPADGVPGAETERATPPPESARSSDGASRVRERAAIEAEIRRTYEDIGRDVQLSAHEAQALISLLTDQLIHMADSRFENSVAGAAERQELQTQFRQEIAEQIGATRAASLASYERSLHARIEVEELRRLLEAELMPMTEKQRTTLIRRAIEQGAFVEPTVFTGAESQLARMQEHGARYELLHQRMAGVAREVLDANQLERYEAWVTSRRESNDKLIRNLEAMSNQR